MYQRPRRLVKGGRNHRKKEATAMNGVQPSTLWKHSPGGAPRGTRTEDEDAKGGPGATSPLWPRALGPWRSPGLGLSGWEPWRGRGGQEWALGHLVAGWCHSLSPGGTGTSRLLCETFQDTQLSLAALLDPQGQACDSWRVRPAPCHQVRERSLNTCMTQSDPIHSCHLLSRLVL